MDKSSKLYNKALEKYNKGLINKAEDLCEKSISLNIKNSAAINLKGLLYYIKGDLDNCRRLWKMNFQINKDRVSEKYIQDSKNDERLLKLYNTALILIKELKINEALILLNECENSHFNYINVNNYLALCYIKKGDYTKASEYLDNVLKADNKNKIALQNRKSLAQYNHIKKNIKFKSIVIPIISILLIASTIIVLKYNGINVTKELKDNKNKIVGKVYKKDNNLNKINTNTNTISTDKKSVEPKIDKSKKEIFPYNEIKKHIAEKDFNKIHEDLIKWNNKSLSINEKSLLGQEKDLMNSAGGEYYYNNGYDFLMKGDYNKAKINLQRAYEYGSGNWYHSHAVYLLGTIYENLEDVETAIKYYTIYDNNFNNGDYEETVLYNLCLLYKNIDIAKGKSYAQKLISKFPTSIYNNSKIQNLISN